MAGQQQGVFKKSHAIQQALIAAASMGYTEVRPTNQHITASTGRETKGWLCFLTKTWNNEGLGGGVSTSVLLFLPFPGSGAHRSLSNPCGLGRRPGEEALQAFKLLE